MCIGSTVNNNMAEMASPEVLIKEEDVTIVLHEINSEDFLYSSLPFLRQSHAREQSQSPRQEMHNQTLSNSTKQIEWATNDPLLHHDTSVETIERNLDTNNKKIGSIIHDSYDDMEIVDGADESLINKSSNALSPPLMDQYSGDDASTPEQVDISLEVSSYERNTVEDVPHTPNSPNHADYHIIDERHPNSATNVVVCSTLKDIASVKQRKTKLRRMHYKYECEVCLQRYSTALVLKSHKVRHLARCELPYQCAVEECQFTAATKIECERHEWRHLQRGGQGGEGIHKRGEEETIDGQPDHQQQRDRQQQQQEDEQEHQCHQHLQMQSSSEEENVPKRVCKDSSIEQNEMLQLTCSDERVSALTRVENKLEIEQITQQTHKTKRVCATKVSPGEYRRRLYQDDIRRIFKKSTIVNSHGTEKLEVGLKLHISNMSKLVSEPNYSHMNKLVCEPNYRGDKNPDNNTIKNKQKPMKHSIINKIKLKISSCELDTTKDESRAVLQCNGDAPEVVVCVDPVASHDDDVSDDEAEADDLAPYAGGDKEQRRPTKLQCGLCVFSCSAVEVLSHHLSSSHRHDPRVAAAAACPVCATTFTSVTNLRAHLLSHADERQYRCDECERTFIMKNRLMAHKRVVHCPKTFTCSYCGKAFPTVHHLSRHERIHTGEKPYRCCFCPFACNTQGNLVKHVRTRHDRPQYNYKQHLIELGSVQQHIPAEELQLLQAKGAAVASQVLAKLDRPGLDIAALRVQVQQHRIQKQQMRAIKKQSGRKRKIARKSSQHNKMSSPSRTDGTGPACASNCTADSKQSPPKSAVTTHTSVIPNMMLVSPSFTLQSIDEQTQRSAVFHQGLPSENSSIQLLAARADDKSVLCTYSISSLLDKSAIIQSGSPSIETTTNSNEVHNHEFVDQYYLSHFQDGKIVVIPIWKTHSTTNLSTNGEASVKSHAIVSDGSELLAFGAVVDGSSWSHDASNGTRTQITEVGPGGLQNDQSIDTEDGSEENIQVIASDGVIEDCLDNDPEYIIPELTECIDPPNNQYQLIQLPNGKMLQACSDSDHSRSNSPENSLKCCADLLLHSTHDPDQFQVSAPGTIVPCDITIRKVTNRQLSIMTQLAADDEYDSETETYIINTKDDVDDLLSGVVENVSNTVGVLQPGSQPEFHEMNTNLDRLADNAVSSQLVCTSGTEETENNVNLLQNDFTIHMMSDDSEDCVGGDILQFESQGPKESSYIVEFGGTDSSAICELLQIPRSNCLGSDSISNITLNQLSGLNHCGEFQSCSVVSGATLSTAKGSSCAEDLCAAALVDDKGGTPEFEVQQDGDGTEDVLVFLIAGDPSEGDEKW